MKVFVITRNLVLDERSSSQQLNELVNRNEIKPAAVAPLCVVETQAIRVIRNMDDSIHSYRVQWWANDTYGNFSTSKDFLVADVFTNEEDAFEELEKRLQQINELARRKYVWSPNNTKRL